MEAYPTDPKSIEGQFQRFEYPAPGHGAIKMYYKYGGSHFGTMTDTNRYARMYRSDNLEFVVNQSIWMEGETKFADVILPACTNFERWDISEFANCGGYIQHAFTQCNHRVAVMQHKCIEPLGESKSDHQIFLELADTARPRLMFSEGVTEIDWCKRLFDATDLPQHVSWKDFLKKGYYVVPPLARGPPRPGLLPLVRGGSRQGHAGAHAAAGRLHRGVRPRACRPSRASSSSSRRASSGSTRTTRSAAPIMRYVPAWEGPHCDELYAKYPLQLITPHPRHSFHTQSDGKDAVVNDIRDHRVLVDGHYYWIVRRQPRDASRARLHAASSSCASSTTAGR